MAYRYFNPNPTEPFAGDCVVRGLCKLLDQDWEETYFDICAQGFIMHGMPSSNKVWGRYLYNNGFRRTLIPDTCPECYTVRDFCIDHPVGKYLIAAWGHVIAVENGDYYDAWDSGNEVPLFYWRKEL